MKNLINRMILQSSQKMRLLLQMKSNYQLRIIGLRLNLEIFMMGALFSQNHSELLIKIS